MITGLFENMSGAPKVEGVLRLPNLNVVSKISFLVDTVADMTTLMPINGQSIGIDYGRLTYPDQVVGVGGVAQSVRDDAQLIFWDPGRRRLWVYLIDIDIMAPAPNLVGVPSLLGRDILDRWRMVCDKARDKLTFTVRSADDSYQL